MDPALEKLRAALEEYLAAGGDTPVAPEAQALMAAIDAGGDVGGAPQGGLGDLGGAPDPNAANPYPGDIGGTGPDTGAPTDNSLQGQVPQGQEMPPPQPNAKTFEGAREGAKKRLKVLNKK